MAENAIPSPDETQNLIGQMREWVKSRPDFPEAYVDDKFLLRFLHSCYYDLEKTKRALELFFTIRASSPELLNNRDPLSPQVQTYMKFVNLAHYQISKNRSLWIWQLNDPGLDNFDYLEDCRLFFMSTDAWLLENEVFEDSDIVILDVKDISLKFLTKFNVSIAKKLSKYQEEAMPIRLKQVHIINAAHFIDKIFALIKPFLKNVKDVVHFHSPKSSSFNQFFEKTDLPQDYGGTLEPMELHMKRAIELLERQRKPLMDDNLWKLKVEKKSKTKNAKELSEETSTNVGSFRHLSID